MSELPKYKTQVSLESSIKNTWMDRLLKWADKNMINELALPRDMNVLFKLKSLKLTFDAYYTEETVYSDQADIRAEELSKSADILVKQLLDELEAVSNFEALKESKEISKYISKYTFLPSEIGNLYYLEELCINWSSLHSLPDEIMSLKHLRKLCLCFNPYLILTEDQKKWVSELEANGADVYYGNSFL